MRIRTLLSTTLVLATVVFWTMPARADLTYTTFVFEGIEEVTDLDLDDRLGTTNGSTEHVINIEDCEAYEGGKIKVYWSVSPTVLDADYAIKRAVPESTCSGDTLTDLGAEDEDSCPERLAGPSDLGSSHEFEVDMDDILDLDPDTSGVDCLAGEEFTTYLYVVVEYSDGTFENETIDFTVDLDAPAAPLDVEAIAGENSIRVSWTDDVNTEDDVEYRVYYRANAPIEAAEDADGTERSGDEASSLTITGLQTNVLYYFRVVAIDANDNESDLSQNSNVFATTIPATDFWEHYQNEGGESEGGFCFIATAAYGTEMESHVHWLRRFRDRFLMPTAPGRAFVSWYYENSPPLALFIRDQPVLAAVVRIVLAPLVLMAWFLIALGPLGKVAFVASVWMVTRVARQLTRKRFATGAPVMLSLREAQPVRRSSTLRASVLRASVLRASVARTLVAVLAAGFSLGAFSSPAHAGLRSEDFFVGDSPQHVLFELKFGPYKPNIDNEFDTAKPYEDIFGSSSFLLSAIQLEYEFFQDWGVASAGGGVGFAMQDGKALTAGGTAGIEETSLYVMPLNVSLTYHLDVFAKKWSFPLVPYVRAGFDYVIWWTTDGLGDLSDWKAEASDSATVGYGGTWGWHVTGGVKLLLDILAPQMARTFDIEAGVNNSYLFAEYMYLRADNFGAKDGLRLGDGTFMFGLAFEI